MNIQVTALYCRENDEFDIETTLVARFRQYGTAVIVAEFGMHGTPVRVYAKYGSEADKILGRHDNVDILVSSSALRSEGQHFTRYTARKDLLVANVKELIARRLQQQSVS